MVECLTGHSTQGAGTHYALWVAHLSPQIAAVETSVVAALAGRTTYCTVAAPKRSS